MENEMSIKTYREAIHDALEEEMDRDADVILMGEDIGVYGGGFGGALIESFKIDSLTPNELISIANRLHIDLNKYIIDTNKRSR